MKVLYDSRTFSQQTFGGISRYFVELINHLPDGVGYELPLYASENVYLPKLRKKPATVSLKNFPEHRKLYYFINGIADRKALRKGGYDVFHPTGIDPYFLGRVKSPVVVTVHDMTNHYIPDSGKHTAEIMENMRKTTLAAQRVIAISEATKRGIMDFYSIPEDRIDVIHHGFTPAMGNSVKPAYCPQRYILFVGQRGGYKNFTTLLDAFSIVAGRFKDLTLFCTGRRFSSQEVRRINELGLSGKVVCRFIPDDDMSGLYANAECFVFPSKMEGFGMPVLEAFSAGCPVILSDTSCFPEVAGDGGIYFNPDDARELAERIERVIEDKTYRKMKTDAGMLELNRFSWDKTALKTAETYRKAIEF